MDNKVSDGTNILTDNWLLQTVAGLLSGHDDPNTRWSWFGVTNNLTLLGNIRAGVFQLDCLITLLEHIIYADSLFMLKDWMSTWIVHDSSLNRLLQVEQGKFINPIESIPNNDDRSQLWLKRLLRNEDIKKKFEIGNESYIKGNNNGEFKFFSQVINGIAEYLTLSDEYGITYSPQSVRAGYLKSTIWNFEENQQFSKGINRFNKLLDESRSRLLSLYNPSESITKLLLTIPSAVLLCIAESNASISPIDVAIQIRSTTEVKNLRRILHELSVSMNNPMLLEWNDVKKTDFYVETLKTIINKNEKVLFTANSKFNKELSCIIDLEYFNYCEFDQTIGFNPNNLESHKGIIAKLLSTTNPQIIKIIMDKLKIDNPTVIKQYLVWNRNTFFSESVSASNITYNNQYYINMEEYINDHGIVMGNFGPDGQFYNFSSVELSKELGVLLEHLKEKSTTTQDIESAEVVSNAKNALDNGDKRKAIEILKKAPKFLFETASKIGTTLTASLLKDLIIGKL
jgi:hypothetical protein